MISRSERNLDVDVAGRNTTASINQHKPAWPKTSKETLKTTAGCSVMTPASQEGINLQWQTQQNSVAGLNFLIVTLAVTVKSCSQGSDLLAGQFFIVIASRATRVTPF